MKRTKERLQKAAQRAAANPVLRRSARSLKPEATLWGMAGTILFFILPEVVGFLWGSEITAWAHRKMLEEPDAMGRKVYWLIEKLFEDGGSWVNLGIGVAILGWLIWERWFKAPSA